MVEGDHGSLRIYWIKVLTRALGLREPSSLSQGAFTYLRVFLMSVHKCFAHLLRTVIIKPLLSVSVDSVGAPATQ